MEALEPRVLLADELIVGIGDVNFKPVHLPDDKIEVPITIQNVSASQISGKIRVRIWASNEDILDASDYLCFDGDISINPRANQVQLKKLKARLPLHMVPDEYQFIVQVSEAQSMLPTGVTFAEPVADDDETFDLRWQFGSVDGRSGNTTLRFMNSDDVIYKMNFSRGFDGFEFGEVFIGPFAVAAAVERGPVPFDQELNLMLRDTSFDDAVAIRRVGGPKDPGLFYLAGIFTGFALTGARSDFGGIGFFDAPDLTLYGESSFNGGVHKLFLGDIINANQVGISGVPFAHRTSSGARGAEPLLDRVSIKVRDVVGTRFIIDNMVLANMKADSFSGELPILDGIGGILANSIDRVEIRNDFEGYVEVIPPDFLRGGGLELPENAINRFVVGGHLTGGLFAFGDVARLQAGSIGAFEAAIHGRLERLEVKHGINEDLLPDALRGPPPITTIIGAKDISRVDIGGDVYLAQVFAGLAQQMLRGGFEPGSIYGGTVANTAITSGIIGRINIGGDMFISEFAAGVNPDGGTFFSGTGRFLIGDRSVSRIGPVKVGGVAMNQARFVSGDFPDNVSINGSSYSTPIDPEGLFVFAFPQL